MNSRFGQAALLLAGVIAAGLALHPLLRGGGAPETAPVAATDSGPGVAVGLLGGLRALVADLAWLQTYASWEEQDVAATTTGLRLTTAVDARPLVFWLNGARMLAYDVPQWRIDRERRRPGWTEAAARRIGREQAEAALAWLRRAEGAHPGSAALAIERAGIEWHALGDLAAAADDYRRAAEMPGAPYFAARLHAELLRRLGRPAAALAWLVRLHPTLPADDPAAQADLVLERIRALETELGVPAARRYRRPPANRP